MQTIWRCFPYSGFKFDEAEKNQANEARKIQKWVCRTYTSDSLFISWLTQRAR